MSIELVMGKKWEWWQILFSGAPKSLQMVTVAKKLKDIAPWKKIYENLESVLKGRDITLLTKVSVIKAMVFLLVL